MLKLFGAKEPEQPLQQKNTTGWIPLTAKDSCMFIPLSVYSTEEQEGIIQNSSQGYNIHINVKNVWETPLPPTLMDPMFHTYNFDRRVCKGILMFDKSEKDLGTAITEDIGRITADIGEYAGKDQEEFETLKKKKRILLGMQEILAEGRKDQVPQSLVDFLGEASIKTSAGKAKPDIQFFTLERDPMGLVY